MFCSVENVIYNLKSINKLSGTKSFITQTVHIIKVKCPLYKQTCESLQVY